MEPDSAPAKDGSNNSQQTGIDEEKAVSMAPAEEVRALTGIKASEPILRCG